VKRILYGMLFTPEDIKLLELWVTSGVLLSEGKEDGSVVEIEFHFIESH
jgi:hypothetical protein